MEITLTLTRAELAAVREDLRIRGADPRESGVEAHASAVLRAALNALRDITRTDAIRTAAFIQRFPPAAYVAILAAAQNSPQLSAYLDRLNSADWVWLGSPETQAGIAALVEYNLLTQEQADTVLFIPLRELPE